MCFGASRHRSAASIDFLSFRARRQIPSAACPIHERGSGSRGFAHKLGSWRKRRFLHGMAESARERPDQQHFLESDGSGGSSPQGKGKLALGPFSTIQLNLWNPSRSKHQPAARAGLGGTPENAITSCSRRLRSGMQQFIHTRENVWKWVFVTNDVIRCICGFRRKCGFPLEFTKAPDHYVCDKNVFPRGIARMDEWFEFELTRRKRSIRSRTTN